MKSSDKIHVTLISEGRFQNRAVLRKMVQLEGKVCEVIIREKREYRGLESNADYFGNIVPVITQHQRHICNTKPDGSFYTEQEVHKELARVFLTVSELIDPSTGEYVDRVRSTTELTAIEMATFKHQVCAWAIEEYNFDPETAFPKAGAYQEFTFA